MATNRRNNTSYMNEPQQAFIKRVGDILKENETLKQQINQEMDEEALLWKVDQWGKAAIEKIQSITCKAREEIKRLIQPREQLSILTNQLSDAINQKRTSNSIAEEDLDKWTKQLTENRDSMKLLQKIDLVQENEFSLVCRYTLNNPHEEIDDNMDSSPKNIRRTPSIQDQPSIRTSTSQDGFSASSPYLSVTFGLSQSTHQSINVVFQKLMTLQPMNKNGPMNGRCEFQTDQMEHFLQQTFHFRNTPGATIVQGVTSFRLGKQVRDMDPKAVIHFPKPSENAFAMTVKEIIDWQRSYRVYTREGIREVDHAYLHRALQGQSRDGSEAFYMKFVVRISTCPIFMEFDAKLIPRTLNEDWPHRIKLVSVTGIDFAGRKHDVCDILYYLSNWKDVFEVDRTKNEPALLNERDFLRKRGGPRGTLEEDRLLRDLTDMARLRLQACDREGVQIVVETGIGLGVFAGSHIGIDEKVRLTSALAIRTVLEQEGSSYMHIQAIVFALPIFDRGIANPDVGDTFQYFAEEFQNSTYKGPIPVLIADQDMHRLTVSIARQGFIVSELNPADSHGVFGEYWQNRGPAVEEKLALTTAGLLVQHHLINPHVLDAKNYIFLKLN